MSNLRLWFSDNKALIKTFFVSLCKGFFTTTMAIWSVFGAACYIISYAPEWSARHPKLFTVLSVIIGSLGFGLFCWSWSDRVAGIAQENSNRKFFKRAA